VGLGRSKCAGAGGAAAFFEVMERGVHAGECSPPRPQREVITRALCHSSRYYIEEPSEAGLAFPSFLGGGRALLTRCETNSHGNHAP
jgi:hypothetical protein